MKASSGPKRSPSTGQSGLQVVIAKLHEVDKKHSQAVLSFKEDPLGPAVALNSKTGGALGRLRRLFQDPQQLEEKSRKAVNFLIEKLKKHGHSLSPEIQQDGLKQLHDLLQQPLGKGMPVKTALHIFEGMQRRQEQKYLDAATHAKDMRANCEKRFEDLRARPPQLSPVQVPGPDALINHANTQSVAYRDYATKASRGDPDAGHKAASPQLDALGHLANMLQILQTATDDPTQPLAWSLQQVWSKLPVPDDIKGMFTPQRFSRHVGSLLHDCEDALQALKQSHAAGNLDEARKCCLGYTSSFELLIDDLLNTADHLLNALAQNQLPPDLGAADKAFLLTLGESLLATVYALVEPGSPLMANHQAALALESKNDTELKAVFKHWSGPPRPDHLPPATLTALDLTPPASPRLPPFRRPSDEPLRTPNGRLDKTAVGDEIVKRKKLPKRLSTGDIPAIKAYKESLPDPENDPLFKSLRPRSVRPETPRVSLDPKDELDAYLNKLEQQQYPFPSANEVMGGDPLPVTQPLPPQSSQATDPEKTSKRRPPGRLRGFRRQTTTTTTTTTTNQVKRAAVPAAKPDVPKPPLAKTTPAKKTASADVLGSLEDQVERFLGDLEASQTALPDLQSVTSFVSSPRRSPPSGQTEEKEQARRQLVKEEVDHLLRQMEEGHQPKPFNHPPRDPASGRPRAVSVPTVNPSRAAQETNSKESTEEKQSRLQRATRQMSDTLGLRRSSKSDK